MDLWRTRFKLSSLNKKQAALVYDIHEETKDYNREVIHILHGLYRYSIFHGVDINSNINVDRDHLVTLGDKLKVYLFSREEEAYYQKRFGLSGQHMEVVGIPRHDKDWVEFIRSKQVESTGAIQEKECAVLFSRSMSPYFPPDRKRRALRAVKEVVIEKYGLNLLIKLHPKEHQDGMFYDVFGENEFDKSWSISNEHPFVLAEKCAFAITFYSGVAIDMNMLGVPVAEYLDLRGLPDYDNVDSLRVDGVPVLSFRYLGLVKGVSTPKQLESAVTEFVEGGGMAQRYSKRYDELFPRQSKLSSHIATELIDSISAEAPISER